MIYNPVEQLKNQYTDKYVAVDATRPELARFRGAVGQIKTVNMNGRALVQFLDYHLNTGWFDIDLACLTVVDPPPKDVTTKPEAKRPHDKPEGKAAPTGEVASATGPSKPAPAPGAKKSTTDVLAAARAAKGAPGEVASATGTAKPAAQKPAAAAKAETPAKVERAKMSVADMLAAARGNNPAAAEAAPAPAAKVPPAAPAAAPKAAAPPAAPAPPPPTPEPAAEGAVKRVDKSSMSIADILAYCRQVDTK